MYILATKVKDENQEFVTVFLLCDACIYPLLHIQHPYYNSISCTSTQDFTYDPNMLNISYFGAD